MSKLLAASLVINLVLAGVLLFNGLAGNPELANKPEWSILQTIDLAHRERTDEPPILIIKNHNGSGYDAVGILDEGSGARTWLLTNAKYSPMIKVLPQEGSCFITSQQFKEIAEAMSLNDEVKTYLSACRR